MLKRQRRYKLAVRTVKKVVVHRRYQLKLYGNKTKTDTARYTQVRFNQYCNMFMGRIFFGAKKISTKGLGNLANQALYRSKGIVNAIKASSKATGNKMNVPFVDRLGCYAKLETSKTKSFDYWVRVSNQFGGDTLCFPAKSHRAFNQALKEGWKVSKLCEFKIINGNSYAVVFLDKEVTIKNKVKNVVGVDVGYKYSIVDSTGYIGRKTSPIIRRSKELLSQRRRSGKKSAKTQTTIKQILNIEAKRLIGRSERVAFAVENPKRLANLSSGKLHGWARSYFANRLSILCKENGIPMIEVSPYQTSITCSKCQAIDKQSRVSRDKFKCSACGFTLHADINASRNIAQKGTVIIRNGMNPGQDRGIIVTLTPKKLLIG